MSKLTDIHKGKSDKPPRIILYGISGIGKTTWAAHAQNPIFIQTEDGLGQIDCDSFPISKSYEDVLDCISSLGTEEHDYKTVVLDSADWLEPLIIQSVCDDYGVKSIHQAAGGYNRGYDKMALKWTEITKALDWLRNTKNMAVIVISHSMVKTFNDPENPAYDKYQLRLHDKSCNLLMQWADCVLFATRKMMVTKADDGKNKAQAIGANGGERVIRCNAGPACEAKNRYNLPDELPLDWDAFEEAIKQNNQ